MENATAKILEIPPIAMSCSHSNQVKVLQAEKLNSNCANLMAWDVVVQMVVEVVETEIAEIEVVEREVVEPEIVVTKAVAPWVVLLELVVVQFEFALLSGIVPQWDSSGNSPLPAT